MDPDAVVQVVFQRVHEGAHLDLFFALQLDVGIDELVGEHAALGQERAALVEFFQRLFQAAANLRDFLRLFRRQVVQVLVGGIAGWILFWMPSRLAISSAAKAR